MQMLCSTRVKMAQNGCSGGIVLLLLMVAFSDVSFQDFTCPGKCQCDDILLQTNCSSTAGINETVYYNVSHLSTVLLLEENLIKNATSVVPWNKLKNLRKLSLALNYLQTLELGTVSFSSKLLYLDLSQNYIYTIPDEIQTLSSLKYLDLSENIVSVLQPDNFYNLNSLQTLRIVSNGIQTVRPNTFMFSYNLEGLFLSGSYFSQSPSCINVETWFGNNMTQISALRELDLSRSSIICLEESSFRSFENLERLDLSHNYLQTVQPSLINKLPRLKHLSLEDTYLTEIPWGFFNGTNHLRYLNLALNSLSSAQNILVESLRKIEVLNLKNNNISIPSPLNFRDFKYLKELYLRRNHITIFPLVQNLKKLEVLDLSKNFIKVVSPNALHKCDGLTKVLLTSNSVESFQPRVELLENIEEFRIDNNRLGCDCKMLEYARNMSPYKREWFNNMLDQAYCYMKPDKTILQSYLYYYTDMICHHVTPLKVAKVLIGTWLSLVVIISCFVWIKTICSAKRKQNAWSSAEFKKRKMLKERTIRDLNQEHQPQGNPESSPVWEKETLLQTDPDVGEPCSYDIETKLSEAPWKSMTETFV